MPDKVQVVQQNIDSELGLSSSHIQVDKVQSPLAKAARGLPILHQSIWAFL